MSRTLRNLLAVAVMTAVVGSTSAAQAARINLPALRRQHPGVGFYSHAAPIYRSNVVRRTALPQFTSFLPPVRMSNRSYSMHHTPGTQHLTWHTVR